MSDLAESRCGICRADTPQLTDTEQTGLLAEIPDWRVQDSEGVAQLIREFSFSNYPQAVSFTLRVAEIAEQEDHHPSLLTEWGRVTVTWWTHSIKGLHRNDFVMAAKTDQLYNV